MNRHLILTIACLVAIACAATAWQQNRHAVALDSRLAVLNTELQKKNADAKQQTETTARLKTENAAYISESAALRERLAALHAATPPPVEIAAATETAGTPSPKKRGMKDILGGMMKDPQMKEMMRQQQGVILKQMYGDFIKSRGLSAQQADQFVKLLTDKQTSAMDEGMNALNGGEQDPAANTTAAQTVAESSAEADRQLKMLLGDAGFAGYQEYEKTTGERMALTQVRQQLAGNSTPLRDDQANSLLKVMVEERSKAPAADLAANGWSGHSMKTPNDPAKANEFYRTQADLNQRILNRAGGILEADQLSALESYQKQQLEMAKLGMEMARKMMGNEDDGSTTFVLPGTTP